MTAPAQSLRRPSSRRGPHPFARLLAPVLVVLALTSAGSALAAGYSYDVDLYNTYVSNGTWWTYSSMTNWTSTWLDWKVTFNDRSCTELSGAVTLGIAAGIAPRRSTCTTSNREMSTTVAPRSSAAVKRRDVVHYDYYFVRKIYRSSGMTVATGYVTRKDAFTEYAFSSIY